MSFQMVRKPPRWPTILVEQFRLLLLRQRWELGGLAAVAVVIVGGMTIATLHMQKNPPPGWSLAVQSLPDVAVPCAFAALFWAFATWKQEDPSRRSYHWSMPLPRWCHGLLRVSAGWLIVMGMVATFLALLAAKALVIGAAHVVADAPPSSWLLPFATASLGYVFGSALLVATRHPGRWLFYGCFAWFGVLFMNMGALSSDRSSVLYSVVNTMIAITRSAFLAAGRLYPETSGAAGLGSWTGAFWGALGLALLALALVRHRNT